MNQTHTNKPEGKDYNLRFSESAALQARRHGQGDRSRLFQMMDALPQIEEWRRTLPLTECPTLNHPNAILREFKAVDKPDSSKPVKPGLRNGVVELSEENVQLKAHVAELKRRPGQGSQRRLASRVGSLTPSSNGSSIRHTSNYREP
jgi:hypothetical protein